MPTAVRSILLVDDDDADQLIHRRVIRQMSASIAVHCEPTAKAALDYLVHRGRSGETLPELILLDINMPGRNGWELIDDLVQEFEQGLLVGRPLPTLVMLSTSTAPEDLGRAAAHPNIHGYLNKPLTVESYEALLTNP